RLGHGHLDLGHMVPVPQRLEDAVGEAEHEDVLHRFLAEVVVDPVDLFLMEGARELPAQRTGARVVAPERLLHDDPREAASRRARTHAEFGVRHPGPCGRDDGERLGEHTPRVEAPEGGHELAPRQVARRAEDDQREGLVVGHRRYPRPAAASCAAAARSRSQTISPWSGCTIAAGSGARSPRTALTAFAFSASAARHTTRSAALKTGSVSVRRCGIDAAPTCTAATARNTSRTTGEPGKR